MKKKAFLRGLLGFPLGIAIGHILSVIGSFIFGNGAYSPCTPELVSAMGSEINAVVLQTLLCGVIGTSFAAGSVVWEMEEWSMVRQTGVYFLINSLVMLPVAYILNWMEHSFVGFLIYFAVFILYFVLIWGVWYLVWKQCVKKLNQKLGRITIDAEKSE